METGVRRAWAADSGIAPAATVRRYLPITEWLSWLDGQWYPNPSGFKSWCSHYFCIYFRISGDALLVEGDVLVDDEASTVTS